ncbi:MAG: glycine--tRNA ligase subunit beta, partial [Anaerolineae bacterium]|nr:glycine--tRNA ligase subunit beta [Anaerolineae bacterium]
GAMRTMTLNVAKLYAQQRTEMEHPLNRLSTGWEAAPATPTIPALPSSAAPAPFLLEIGVEELPAQDVDSAYAQLQAAAPAFFEGLRLAVEGLQVYATPRRLVIYAASVAPRQTDETEAVRGPALKVAFNEQGQPTRAAEGFARKFGLEANALERRSADGGEYVYAIVQHVGRPAPEVLAEALPGLIASIKFDKSMRWNASGIAFSRPLRWIVALWGSEVLPFEYAQVPSGATTRGVRGLGAPEISLADIPAYFAAMQNQGIVLDPATRCDTIWAQVEALATEVGGACRPRPGSVGRSHAPGRATDRLAWHLCGALSGSAARGTHHRDAR